MGDQVMVSEFPESAQRYQVCSSQWDQKLKKNEIIERIERIKYLIYKGDYYDSVEAKLADLMVNRWDQAGKDMIADLIRKLKGTTPYRGMSADSILSDTEKDFIADVQGKLDEPVSENIHDIYLNSKKEILGTGFSFSLKDKKAMEWLANYNKYWIGNFYDDQVHSAIRDEIQYVIDEGMTTETAGKYLSGKLGSIFDKPPKYHGNIRSYYELLSNHVVRRSREFARTTAYSKEGIEYLRIVAVLDHRTTMICQEMNGRIIPVKWSEDLMDSLINANSPADVKSISPWLNDKDVGNLVAGKNTRDLPHNLSMPPYHARCRTRTIRSSLDEWDSQTFDEDNGSRKKIIPVTQPPPPPPPKPPVKPAPPSKPKPQARNYNIKDRMIPHPDLPDQFIEAMNRNDALDYMGKYFGDKIGFRDPKKFSVDVLNFINRGLHECFYNFGFQGKLEFIGTWQEMKTDLNISDYTWRRLLRVRGAPAAHWGQNSGRLIFHKDKFPAECKGKGLYAGANAQAEKRGASVQSRYTNFKAGKYTQEELDAFDFMNSSEWKNQWTVGSDPISTVYHEIGHHFAYIDDTYGNMSYQAAYKYRIFRDLLSEYGSTKPQEFQAESFAAFMEEKVGGHKNMYKRIHPDLLDYFNKMWR